MYAAEQEGELVCTRECDLDFQRVGVGFNLPSRTKDVAKGIALQHERGFKNGCDVVLQAEIPCSRRDLLFKLVQITAPT
jgi:hypothetical protein